MTHALLSALALYQTARGTSLWSCVPTPPHPNAQTRQIHKHLTPACMFPLTVKGTIHMQHGFNGNNKLDFVITNNSLHWGLTAVPFWRNEKHSSRRLSFYWRKRILIKKRRVQDNSSAETVHFTLVLLSNWVCWYDESWWERERERKEPRPSDINAINVQKKLWTAMGCCGIQENAMIFIGGEKKKRVMWQQALTWWGNSHAVMYNFVQWCSPFFSCCHGPFLSLSFRSCRCKDT